MSTKPIGSVGYYSDLIEKAQKNAIWCLDHWERFGDEHFFRLAQVMTEYVEDLNECRKRAEVKHIDLRF